MRTIHALFGAPHGAKRADPPALAPRNENENEVENEGEKANPALERPEKRRRGSAPRASSLGECPHKPILPPGASSAHAAGCAGKVPPPTVPRPNPTRRRRRRHAPTASRHLPLGRRRLRRRRTGAGVRAGLPGRAAAGRGVRGAHEGAARGDGEARIHPLARCRTDAFRWALERGSEPGAASAALAVSGGLGRRVRPLRTHADGRPCDRAALPRHHACVLHAGCLG